MSKRMTAKQQATIDLLGSVVNTCGFEKLTITMLLLKTRYELSIPFEHVFGTAQRKLYEFKGAI